MASEEGRSEPGIAMFVTNLGTSDAARQLRLQVVRETRLENP
jgi:hypothetical protein